MLHKYPDLASMDTKSTRDCNENNKTILVQLRSDSTVQEICEKLGISMRVLLSKYRADVIIYVKELVKAGKSNETIYKMTGISKTTIKRLKNEDENQITNVSNNKTEEILAFSKSGLSPRAIASNFSISVHQVKVILKEEIILSFLKGNGIFNMQSEFSMDARDITKIIHEEGFIIPSSGLTKKIIEHYGEGEFPFYKPIIKLVNDIMEGEIVGDGHIARSSASKEGRRDYHNYELSTELKDYKEGLDNIKEFRDMKEIKDLDKTKEKFNKSIKAIENAKTALFELHKGIKELPIVETIAKILKENGYDSNFIKHEDHFYFKTELSVQIQKMYERFYLDGRKILPDNFTLNEQKVFNWYVGDGTYNKKEDRISFATHNFKENEVRRLSEDLNNKVGIHSAVYKTHDKRYPDSEYWIINIRRKADVDKFFTYIENSNKELLDMSKKTVPHKFKDLNEQ